MFGKLFAGAGSSALDFAKDIWAQENAEGMQHSAQAYAHGEAQLNRDFQERMRRTQYQTAMEDMRASGLNPMLAFQQGGAGTPGGAMAAGGGGHPASVTKSNIVENAVTAAQIHNVSADTEVKNAQADEIRARTPTHAVSIDQMRANIENLLQQVRTGGATAANLQQQTTNLRELVPQIRAMTDNLRQHTELQLQQTGLTDTQRREIQQRIEAALPQLERALGELEIFAQKLAQEGHITQSDVQSSFVGKLGAYLRALIPLGGVMGAIPLGRLRTTPAPDRRPQGTPAERNYYRK